MASQNLKTYAIVGLWIALAAVIGAIAADTGYRKVGGGLLIGLGLLIIAVNVLPMMVPLSERRFLVQLLAVAGIAKLIATGVRLFVAKSVYGYSDAIGYDSAGNDIAGLLWSGNWSRATANLSPGTDFVDFLTGVIYSITGSSQYGGFLVFSFISLVGAVLFYRAFRIAIPGGNRKLFAVLILLYPSMLYWPSGIGKDSLMMFLGGLTALGVASLLARGRWSGLLFVAVGLMGIYMVRPPFAVLTIAALLLGLLIKQLAARKTGRLASLFVVTTLMTVVLFGASVVAPAVGLDSLSPQTAVGLLVQESNRDYDESGAGSNFDLPAVNEPAWAPTAFVTVLFRPFPWEARNPQSVMQSLDGILMGVLLLIVIRRVMLAGKTALSDPYLMYSVAMLVTTILILGTLGNFGLLARQRASALPFLFVVMAYAPMSAAYIKSMSSRSPAPDDSSPNSRRRLEPVAAH